MVLQSISMKELRQDGKTYYVCGICGLAYLEETLARQCGAWCAQGKG